MTDYDIDKDGNAFEFDKGGRYFKKDIQKLTPHQLIHCQLFGFEVAEFGSTGAEDEIMRRLKEHQDLLAERERLNAWFTREMWNICVWEKVSDNKWYWGEDHIGNGPFDTPREAIDAAITHYFPDLAKGGSSLPSGRWHGGYGGLIRQ